MNNSVARRCLPSATYILMIVFIFSGFAGLIYQSIWSHYLGLFLGHAAYAQALVLAIFMGGMAIGAMVVSRAGLRWKNLIRIYAIVELLIGLMALGFHSFFVWVLDVSYIDVIPALHDSWSIYIYKWSLGAILILPQTILLGATFPLMTAGIIRQDESKGGQLLGGFYFANSIGAATGVLLSAFLIMPMMGLSGALWVAGLINICVAIAAYILGRGTDFSLDSADIKMKIEQPSQDKRRLLYLMLAGTFLSGAASFVYEIVWVRMLSLVVGSTLHAFELMLAAFIAGIAFGGLWIRHRADNSKDPVQLLGWMQVIMGVLVAASLVVYTFSFEWAGFLVNLLSKNEAGYAVYNIGTALVAIIIMFPAAFCAGTTLPLFTTVLLRNGVGEGAIGRIYAWNTLGAILGVVAAVHWLIPVMGLKLSAMAAALVDVAIGMVLLRTVANGNKGFAYYGLIGLSVAAVFSFVMLKAKFDPLIMSSGVYRYGVFAHASDRQVLFYKDGKTASVSVFKSKNAASIATNGKVDASISINNFAPTTDEYTMTLLGALPFAYSEQSKRVGIIGFGSGMTTHVVLGQKRLERVDTVEIERVMVQGARVFKSGVWRAFEDPRSNIVYDDAKSYFSGQQKYDVIISEPSNPWISGVGNLFSKEFYRLAPHFLTDDGVFVQWLQLYEINDQLVASVLKGLDANFADYHAYLANDMDLIIVASPKQKLRDVNFSQLLSGAMGDDLARLGIKTKEQLKLFRVADADILRAYAGMYDVSVNSDYFPILSIKAPETRFMNSTATLIPNLASAPFPILESLGVFSPSGEIGKAKNLFSPSKIFEKMDQAKKLRAVFLGESVDYDDKTLLAVQLKRAIGTCTEDQNNRINDHLRVVQLMELAKATIPYISASNQNGLFIGSPWQECATLSPPVHQFSELLSAVALRDFSLTIKLSIDWLSSIDRRDSFYSEADGMVLIYLQLAYISLERYQEAKMVDEDFSPLVASSIEYSEIQSFLLSWLDIKLNGAHSH